MPNGLSPEYAVEMYGDRRGESRPRSRSRRSARAVSPGRRGSPPPGEMRPQSSLPVVRENSYLPHLFWVRVEPHQASSDFLKQCVLRLSEKHGGHGDLRSEEEVLSVSDWIFDMGVHDLMQITVQSDTLLGAVENRLLFGIL